MYQRSIPYLIVLIGSAMLFLTGCSPASQPTPTTAAAPTQQAVSPTTAPTEQAISPAPTSSGDDVTALVKGNTQFAFDLYHQAAQTQYGNLVFSPYSVSM